MEMFLDFISEYNPIILIVMTILLFIFIIIQIVNKVQLSRLNKRYKKLFRSTKTTNIEALVLDYMGKIEEAVDYTKEVHKAYRGIDNRINACVQKIGIVRYKAFEDVGSDLSFSLALLDESDSGVVLTSIYGRHDSTTFAKQVDNGISKYDLSDEEKDAIERAQKHYESYNKHRSNSGEIEIPKPEKYKVIDEKDKEYYSDSDFGDIDND